MAKILDEGVGNITAALKSKGIYDQTIQIFMYGPAQQMHALYLGLNDPLADLNTAAQRFGYDPVGVDRLCRFGGAPLPRDDRLTLAESGRLSRVAVAENSDVTDEMLHACLEESFRRLQLPRPRGGAVTFSYPIRIER